MAFAINTYTGNGSLTSFSVSFPYIEQAHVIVTVDGVTKTSGSDYSFSNASTIAFSSAPANGAIIKFTRSTNRNARLVDYQDGSTITEAILDQDGNQSFFMAQEAIDITENTIGLDGSDQWDANNKKIVNVTDPTTAQGVSTKNYVDTKLAADISTVNTYKTAAETAKTAAETAETNAETANTSAQSALTQVQTIYDTFDDRFLGAKSSNPSVDNDGNALQDGALYWDTANNLLKVYDLSNTQWVQVQLSSTNQTNVNTVVGQITPTNNIQTVANANSNITTVAGLNSEITTLAGITNLANLANAHAAVTNVNNNLTSVNNFADVYRISASAPTTSLNDGDMWFDTNADKLKIWNGSSWDLAGSSVNGTAQRYKFVATANQTVFTSTDANGNTLTYDSGYIDLYLNGVHLDPSDYTATDGSNIVLGSGAAVNDEIYVVAFGTFSVSSIAGSAIDSGTINDARLPTSMSGKTLVSPTVTGDISQVSTTSLTAKGDGSSADGKITLNCSQNSHGVKIQSPAHSAAQSYTLILPTSVGTANQVLATNGNATNQLSWVDAQETKPTVANVSQTIAPATATTITITGTNFVSIPQVDFVNGSTGAVTRANTVSFTSATSLSVNCTLATGNYYVRIENPDGNAGRSTNNIITSSTAPTFSTSAGSLGSFAGNFSGTVATISGSSDSAITYAETTSNLSGAGVTLNTSTGALTTTDFGGSSTTPTTYNFTIRITDAEGQTADRSFSFTSTFGATGGGQFN